MIAPPRGAGVRWFDSRPAEREKPGNSPVRPGLDALEDVPDECLRLKSMTGPLTRVGARSDCFLWIMRNAYVKPSGWL